MKIALNIGSGQHPFRSAGDVRWINIDKIAHEGMEPPDLVCDGAHLPYSENSVDYVVFHHVLEHLNCNGGVSLVKEAHRVLKPGGSLLVFVPNMRVLCARWLGGELTTQIFMTNVYGAYMGHEEDMHRWGYSADNLCEFLTLVSPEDISWQSWDWFDWREIPGMSAARDYWILAMECVK